MVFLTSGQACAAGTGLLVPSKQLDAVKRATVEAMHAFPVGDPADPKTAVGPWCRRSSTIACNPTSATSQKRGLLMADVKIEARPNGPYVVTGSIELRDTNGNVLATQERTVLCRCGASTKKPFCDGTHSKIGFQAAAEAVPASAEKS
jgi:CDGSH-type Zn-finger protein